MKPEKSGINRPIICKNCGKRVGWVKIEKPMELEVWLKKRKYRIWAWILVGSITIQLVSQLISDVVLGN